MHAWHGINKDPMPHWLHNAYMRALAGSDDHHIIPLCDGYSIILEKGTVGESEHLRCFRGAAHQYQRFGIRLMGRSGQGATG